ncbi:MAG: hypothetical protein ACLQEQ_09730 [Nitrososphaerales archaeon]
MKIRWPVILAFAGVAILVQLFGSPQWMVYATVLSSAIGLGTQVDFESLASRYIDAGHLASTSSSLVGASGVKHRFAFTVSREDGVVQAVADTALSVAEVDEVAVLKFFTKVYDVKPKAAVLCVSPRLNRGASELARQYGLYVLEHEKPRELIPMLARTIDKIVGMN